MAATSNKGRTVSTPASKCPDAIEKPDTNGFRGLPVVVSRSGDVIFEVEDDFTTPDMDDDGPGSGDTTLEVDAANVGARRRGSEGWGISSEPRSIRVKREADDENGEGVRLDGDQAKRGDSINVRRESLNG